MNFITKYFVFNKSGALNVASADLQELADNVSWVELLRASNGHTYYYFFPCNDRRIIPIQKVLAKYRLYPEIHTTHCNFVKQHIVRVRCRSNKQIESIKNIADNVLEYKKLCAQQNVCTK